MYRCSIKTQIHFPMFLGFLFWVSLSVTFCHVGLTTQFFPSIFLLLTPYQLEHNQTWLAKRASQDIVCTPRQVRPITDLIQTATANQKSSISGLLSVDLKKQKKIHPKLFYSVLAKQLTVLETVTDDSLVIKHQTLKIMIKSLILYGGVRSKNVWFLFYGLSTL